MMIICSAFVAINLYIDSFLNTMNKEEVINEADACINESDRKEEAHEVINFLLLGKDNSDADFSDSEGERSDAIKIVSLDYTDKKIKLSNLQRDVVVLMPGENEEYIHLNWAVVRGGEKAAIQTINANLDMDITRFVSISYAGFIAIIDEIGGVDVELTATEAAAFNGLITTNTIMNIEAKEGLNHLDGHDALAYARQRYVDSDFVRVERQNTIIRKVAEKIKELSYTEILNLVRVVMPYITTNLNNEEIKSYLIDVIGFDLGNIQSYTWPLGEYDDIYRCPSIGGYLLKSYSDQIVGLHKYIWAVDDYQISDNAEKIIDDIYSRYGEYADVS